MNQHGVVPPGWARTVVSRIFGVVGGGTPSTAEPGYWDGDIPWITSADIDVHGRVAPRRYVTKEGVENSATNVVPPGSVVVVTRVGLGKAGLIDREICFSQDSHALVAAKDCLNPKFVALQMRAVVPEFKSSSRGTTISGVTRKQLEDLPFLLAPLAEQHRIVAEIEKHLTRLDAAVAGLERVRANLKRYRASVLKAACEGRLVLTEAELARAEGRDYEPASTLLARILDERRARWEAEQLAKMRAAGKEPKDDGWKGKHVEAGSLQRENLPPLPNGWCWATVGQLADVGTGATPLRSRGDYYEGGSTPWVTSGALNQPFVDQAEEFITALALRQTNAKVFPSGALLVAMYGEGKTRGKVSELRIEAATNQACAALVFRPVAHPCKSWVKLFLETNYDDMRRLSAGGVQPNLNLSLVRDTPVPVPPLAEQYRIAAEADRRLSVARELQVQIESNLTRAERLRQAILKRAFEGKLVPQDANDEPASVLLDRIRGEREQAISPRRGTGGPPSLRSKRRSGDQAQLPLPVGT